MTVAPFSTGSLTIDGLEQGTVSLERDAHLSSQFPIEVLDTAFLFFELRMLTRLSGWLRKHEGTAKALREVAVGVSKLKGGMHA